MFGALDNRLRRAPPWWGYAPVSGLDPLLRDWGGRTWWYNGTAWQPLDKDPYFAQVVGLYHFQQFQSDGKLTDSSSKGNHLAGFAGSTTSPQTTGFMAAQKFGLRLPFSTSGGICWAQASSDFSLGSGDWTIELWMWLNDTSSFTNVLDMRTADNSGSGPIFVRNASGKLVFYPSGAGSQITGGTTVSASAWHHTHATKSGGTTYIGLDGAQEGADYTDANTYSGGNLWVGVDAASIGTQMLKGRYGEVRITKGAARYARTYIVPTAPFSNY